MFSISLLGIDLRMTIPGTDTCITEPYLVVGSILHGGLIELFLVPSQCSTTGITNAVVCAILSVRWCI